MHTPRVCANSSNFRLQTRWAVRFDELEAAKRSQRQQKLVGRFELQIGGRASDL
jgi:hypothetical protein